jgi:hypothetical protein
MSDDNLKNLLKKTRLKNEKVNVTGMLLYLDPFFIQILEGEEEIINETFKVIKQDPRHHQVKIIYKKQITERAFPNWVMGFNKISNAEAEEIEGFFDFWQCSTSECFKISSNERERVLEDILNMFRNETLF